MPRCVSLRLVVRSDDKPMDLGMTGICKPTEVNWLENAVNNPGTSPVTVAIYSMVQPMTYWC